jgi:hypothetical protein
MHPEPSDFRLPSLLLAIAYPLLHFATRIEDPEHYEPLWQYLLLSGIFFLFVVLSFTRFGKRWSASLFVVALCIVGFVVLYFSAEAGFSGKRFMVGAFIVASGLFLRSLKATLWYSLFLSLALISLMVLTLFSWIALVRFWGGIILVLLVALARHWLEAQNAHNEKKLHSIILGSPLPMLLLSSEKVLLVNRVAEQLLGIFPGESLSDFMIGEPPWHLSISRRGVSKVRLQTRNQVEHDYDVSFSPVEGEPNLMHIVLLKKD